MTAAVHKAGGAQDQGRGTGAVPSAPADLAQAVSLLCTVVGMLCVSGVKGKKELGADLIEMGESLKPPSPGGAGS